MRRILAVLVMFVFVVPAYGDWETEFRTGRADVPLLQAVCEKLAKAEVNFGKRQQEIALAKDLLAVFNLPWRLRYDFHQNFKPTKSCPGIIGTMGFHNGAVVMEELTYALQRTGAGPKDIGQTPATLRQLLLKDLRMAIVEVRRLYADGYGSRSDFYLPTLRGLIQVAIREWDFIPKDLGLMPEEIELLKPS